MNNIIKELKNIDPVYIDDYVNDCYNTNYDIVDKYGNLVLCKRRQQCFSELLSYHIELITESTNKLLIYALSSEVNLSDEELNKYFRYIKNLGFSFKVKKETDYDLNACSGKIIDNKFYTSGNIEYYTNYVNGSAYRKADACFKRQDVYIIEIDLRSIKSISRLKILYYMIRHIYEYDQDYMIKCLLKYKEKFPRYSFIQLLALFNYLSSEGIALKYGGHKIFSNKVIIHVNTKIFKECLKELENTSSFDITINKLKRYCILCNVDYSMSLKRFNIRIKTFDFNLSIEENIKNNLNYNTQLSFIYGLNKRSEFKYAIE